jgi:hypothetical protein
MTKDEAMRVRVGDKLTPDPMWNDTTARRCRKLPDVVAVLGIIINRYSQTWIMFKVKTIGKEPICLDAGWFSLPEKSQ